MICCQTVKVDNEDQQFFTMVIASWLSINVAEEGANGLFSGHGVPAVAPPDPDPWIRAGADCRELPDASADLLKSSVARRCGPK